MNDHVTLRIDRLPSAGDESSSPDDLPAENEPLIHYAECRICQEEDSLNNLESPCACNGSLKYAHRKCVQRWCDEKEGIVCEICHHQYAPGYTSTLSSHETAIDIDWPVSDPRILTMTDYDEFADLNASGASFCRSAALILMALLLLRHAVSLKNDGEDDDDASAFLSLFVLRAVGFLLSCYIMAWAISMLHRRRLRQEAATEVVLMLQSGGVRFPVAPPPVLTTQEEATPAAALRSQEAAVSP